ncbi:MAG: serine/threonine-protein kinase [Polyangia bacterium]
MTESAAPPPASRIPPGFQDFIGTVIGERYQILEMISHGGMGVVFKARHLTLKNIVAVKVLRRRSDSVTQKRFMQEARLASKIKHPNIVFISDFGVLPDGRSYLVMEYLEGPTLAAQLKQGPLDPLRACRIALQIARGMRAVHQHGIVHRDLKPQKVRAERD